MGRSVPVDIIWREHRETWDSDWLQASCRRIVTEQCRKTSAKAKTLHSLCSYEDLVIALRVSDSGTSWIDSMSYIWDPKTRNVHLLASFSLLSTISSDNTHKNLLLFCVFLLSRIISAASISTPGYQFQVTDTIFCDTSHGRYSSRRCGYKQMISYKKVPSTETQTGPGEIHSHTHKHSSFCCDEMPFAG